MSFAQLPDVRLYYEVYGEGPPIVCVHGTGSDASWMTDAARQIADAGVGRVIVYDRRGCTRSGRPSPYLSTRVEQHADDLAAMLENLDAVPAVVIGRSFGGWVALQCALRHPDAVRALVLLEGSTEGLSADADAWFEALGSRVRGVAERDGVDAVAEALYRSVISDGWWDALSDTAKSAFRANSPAILAELNSPPTHVTRQQFAKLSQPVLCVSAASSPEAFRELMRRTADAVPRGRLHTVDGTHLISPADPDIIAFVETVTA